MFTQLVLLRHGESAGNVAAAAADAVGAELIGVGQRDPDVPLTEVGLAQALALGRGLRSLLRDRRKTAV